MSTQLPEPSRYRAHRSESTANLAKALAAVQAEMEHPKKNATNPHYKSNFADLPTTIDSVKALLGKHGLAVTQIPTVDANGELVLITEVLHVSGESLTGYYPIRPQQNTPQGIGSAITYARRYAYQAMLGIAPAGEDDDGNAASAKQNGGEWEHRKVSIKAKVRMPNDQGGVRTAVKDLPGNPWLHEMEGPNQFQHTALFLIEEAKFRAIAKPPKLASLIATSAITDRDAAAIQAANKDWSGRYAAESDHFPKSDIADQIPPGASWDDIPEGDA